LQRSPASITIPISDAMRSFVSSMHREQILLLWQILGEFWTKRSTDDRVGSYLTLIWNSAIHLAGQHDAALSLISSENSLLSLNNTFLRDIDFSHLEPRSNRIINAANCTLTDVRFDGLSLVNSNFSNITADTVSFRDADLSGANFESSFLFECDMSGAVVTGADFRNLDEDSTIFVLGADGKVIQLNGKRAIGFLNFNGSFTSEVADIYVYMNHPKFPILKKVCERVSEQRNSQLRGLTQRGEATADPPFAREVVNKLESLGWLNIGRNDLVSATPFGRALLRRIAIDEYLDPALAAFLKER